MQNLIEICQELAREGKTPSVGLVKARAGKGAQLPHIVRAVQQWRITPEKALAPKLDPPVKSNIASEHSDSNIQSLEQRVTELEKQLVEANTRISELYTKI